MTTIEETVQATIDQMGTTGKLQQLIVAGVEGAVQEAINKAFCGYGNFTSGVQKAIEEQVEVNLDGIGFAGYNDVVKKVIGESLDGFFYKKAADELKKQMDELLASYPQEIKVSELADKFRDKCIEYKLYDDDAHFTMHVVRSDHLDGYFDIYMDEEPNKEKYSCAFKIRCKEDEVWGVEVEGDKLRHKMFLGPMFGFERFLFHAYTNKVKVVLDTDDPETFYGNSY